MKTYSEEKNNIIEKWGQPREYTETYKGSKYTEFIFTKVSNNNIHYKTIWVYNDLIFKRKKDMINYIEGNM